MIKLMDLTSAPNKSFKKRFKEILRQRGFTGILKSGVKFLNNFFFVYPKLKYFDLISCDGKIIRNIQNSLMVLDLRDRGICRGLLLNGIREPRSTLQIKKELRNGMNILEIGANIGYYVLLESKHIGSGKIYALEPDPRNLNLLTINVYLNNLQDQVKIYPYATGNSNKKIDFYFSDCYNLSGMVSKTNKRIKVKMIRIDDFFYKKEINFLRMDVEGYEFKILKGAKELLKKSIEGMFIEIHPRYLREMGTNVRNLLSWLYELGFKMKVAFEGECNSNLSYFTKKELLNSPKLYKSVGGFP